MKSARKPEPYPIADEIAARVILVPLTQIEAAYVDELRRRGAFMTDLDLVRCALWHLAHHFDLIVQPPIFAIGGDRIEDQR
jgi:hypothetical protein